jgi:hypothetical protein
MIAYATNSIRGQQCGVDDVRIAVGPGRDHRGAFRARDISSANRENRGRRPAEALNDGLTSSAVAEYEQNMANLIMDLRKELGVKNLPVVIADSGFGGRAQKVDRRIALVKAQLAVAQRPEFKGTVTTVDTRDFFRPPDQSPSGQGYHWNGNAETYFLIGDAMGKAMLKLLAGAPEQSNR